MTRKKPYVCGIWRRQLSQNSPMKFWVVCSRVCWAKLGINPVNKLFSIEFYCCLNDGERINQIFIDKFVILLSVRCDPFVCKITLSKATPIRTMVCSNCWKEFFSSIPSTPVLLITGSLPEKKYD